MVSQSQSRLPELDGDLIARTADAVFERLQRRGIVIEPKPKPVDAIGPQRAAPTSVARIEAEAKQESAELETAEEGGYGTGSPVTATTVQSAGMVTLADCLSLLRQRVGHAPTTAKHYDGLVRRWGEYHDGLGIESPDVRDIADGDFATFCEAVPAWRSLRSREKNWSYFSKLLRCRTPRAAGFSWGDPPELAILSRVPLSGLENQAEPKSLQKTSGVLSLDQVEALMVAAAASEWPCLDGLDPAVTWLAFYGLLWLCGIAPDDLLDFEHSGEQSEYDDEEKVVNFIRGKTGVPVHLPLPRWLFPLFDVLKADAIADGRRWLFPFQSPVKPGQRIGDQKILKRVKRHYAEAGVEPIVEKLRKLWLYGFRKTSVTWWISNHPGWQKLVNGHSVEGDVAAKHYAQIIELRPIVESVPAPGVLVKLAGDLRTLGDPGQ